MGIDRKRRRQLAKQRFKVYAGGKREPPPDLSAADRLGAAVRVLIEQFRHEPQPLDRMNEIRVLLDVAAHLAITKPERDCDIEQFANAAAFVYEEMEKKVPPSPEAG